MNLLQKQGLVNTVILYAGILIGFYNLIILFQRALTLEEIGFFTLLIAISGLYAQIGSLGIHNIILRYFPKFKTEDKTHRGFITYVAIFSVTGFFLTTLLFIVFKQTVIGWYEEKQGAELLVKYYYYIIPISFLTFLFSLFESLARAIFQNIYSAFLREVLLRIFTSIGVLLILFHLMDYDVFLSIYLWGNVAIVILLGLSIARSRSFKISSLTTNVLLEAKPMLHYGLFAVLSGGSFVLIQNLDMIMISALTSESLSFVGIYSTFFGIATVISLPAKALNRTSYQIVSNAWEEKDLDKIARIYSKTSTIQFLVGCLLLIGLIVNKQNIMFLLKKPEYNLHFDVFVIIGLAFLVDITGGLNSHIINTSHHFRFVTISLAVAVLLCWLFNISLIPSFGLLGAALAYLLTMFSLNFAYWLFIKLKFKMQPFDIKHILVIVISVIAFGSGILIPHMKNFYLDVIVRSSIVSLVFLSCTYKLKISEDLNNLFDTCMKKHRVKIVK